MIRIFISFSSADRDLALSLKRAIDKIDPDSINSIIVEESDAPTKDLSLKVQENLRNADYLIPIMTDDGLISQWVNQEIGYFIATHGRDRVFPIVEDRNKLHALIHNQLDIPFILDKSDIYSSIKKIVEFLENANRNGNLAQSKKQHLIPIIDLIDKESLINFYRLGLTIKQVFEILPIIKKFEPTIKKFAYTKGEFITDQSKLQSIFDVDFFKELFDDPEQLKSLFSALNFLFGFSDIQKNVSKWSDRINKINELIRNKEIPDKVWVESLSEANRFFFTYNWVMGKVPELRNFVFKDIDPFNLSQEEISNYKLLAEQTISACIELDPTLIERVELKKV